MSAQTTVPDYYGPIVEWQWPTGEPLKPIHISLLPNGKVFFMSPEFEMQPSLFYEQPPIFANIDILTGPFPPGVLDEMENTVTGKSLVCGGNSLMADGKLFFASGTSSVIDLDTYNGGNLFLGSTIEGISESFTYDPFQGSWTQNADTKHLGETTGQPLRWYATVTRLASSKMMVTGGFDSVIPVTTFNNSVEIFDPAINEWTIVSDAAQTPTGIEIIDYPHVFQYPFTYSIPDTEITFNIVMMIGGAAEPLYLLHNDQGIYWYQSGLYRPGAKEFIDALAPTKAFPNHGSSSAILPLRLPEDSWGYTNGSIVNVGGAHGTVMQSSIDVFDLGQGSWRPSISMGQARHHPSTTILPDGRILILAGHDDSDTSNQAGYAQYIDPKNEFALTVGVAYMPEIRGYHTVSLLLPDGRVIVGGGNDDGNNGLEKPNFRYYFPDYMFKARPQLVWSQDVINIAQYFPVILPLNTGLDEANLLGLGSMTHSFDMSQRSVQLRIFPQKFIYKFPPTGPTPVSEAECLDTNYPCYDVHFIQGPDSRESAPPGHYMLFLLDENRVPSVGKIIKLES